MSNKKVFFYFGFYKFQISFTTIQLHLRATNSSTLTKLIIVKKSQLNRLQFVPTKLNWATSS